jgi:CHAT domain-containing protein
LRILPKMAWIGSSILSRQKSLVDGDSEDIACDSAACAIDMGLFEEAIELLDSGRSFIWQQVSALHTDLDVLRHESPELANLADELQNVSQQLAQGAFSVPLVHDWNAGATFDQSQEEDVRRERRRLAAKWEELVNLIRSTLPDFLQPIRFETLRQASSDGPVVIINVSKHRVDALIVTAAQPIQHVPLPRIDAETIKTLSQLVTMNRPLTGASETECRFYTTRHLRPALRRVWKDIMVPVLDKLNIPLKATNGPPERRIWWCPTGPLTFIPIHAAGPFDNAASIDVSRLVISSYTTTLASLVQARKKTALQEGPQQFLLVSHPGTQEQGLLPHTLLEVERVLEVVRSAGELSNADVHLHGPGATVAKVLSSLESCSWVHFACHGVQDVTSGVKSSFLFHDGDLTLDRIASLRVLRGQFAFLSVCHGASGMKDLPGEAMHLAATLHFARFPSVVATMWSIMDQDALRVAELVYRHMLLEDEHRFDSSRAAAALNYAVNALKDGGATLDRWAPFIHIGV